MRRPAHRPAFALLLVLLLAAGGGRGRRRLPRPGRLGDVGIDPSTPAAGVPS